MIISAQLVSQSIDAWQRDAMDPTASERDSEYPDELGITDIKAETTKIKELVVMVCETSSQHSNSS